MSCFSTLLGTVLLVAAVGFGVAFAKGDSDKAEPAPRFFPTTRLTFDGIFKRDPVYTRREGQVEIIYSVQENSVLMVLSRLELVPRPTRETRAERIHPKSRLPEFKPVFAKDGSKYAFLQSRGNQNVTLAYREIGSDKERHLGQPARNPAIAPDGGHILYSKPGKGGQQIVSVDANGKDMKWLTESPSFNNWPAVSPDGKRFLFSSDREDRDLEIWVADNDGKNAKRLTKSPGRDVRASWSPDGKRIAFMSGRDGNSEIYVMDHDGKNVVNLTSHPEIDDYPVWHPDGKKILFVGERSGRFDLYEIEVGSGATAKPDAEVDS